MKTDIGFLRKAHKLSSNNAKSLRSSRICGCFYCCRIFEPKQIEAYIKEANGLTALCPHCNIDSVIGDASGYPITVEFLQEMHKHWF